MQYCSKEKITPMQLHYKTKLQDKRLLEHLYLSRQKTIDIMKQLYLVDLTIKYILYNHSKVTI
jgi:hypothetical protein